MALRERQGLANESCTPLTHRAPEPLDVIGLALPLSASRVLAGGDHRTVGRPEVGDQRVAVRQPGG